MRVSLTGANGFVGSAIVQELIGAGHEVLGLARSDEDLQALTAASARAHGGDLADADSLRTGISETDGVIHTAFSHDFSKFASSAEVDRLARHISLTGDYFWQNAAADPDGARYWALHLGDDARARAA